MTGGFNIRREKPKQKRELVGSERSITFRFPLGEYTRKNIYKINQKNKSIGYNKKRKYQH